MATTKTVLPPRQKPDVDASALNDTPREPAARVKGRIGHARRPGEAAKLGDGAAGGARERALQSWSAGGF